MRQSQPGQQSRPPQRIVAALTLVGTVLLGSAAASAAWVSSFADGDSFEGDLVGDTAGPFTDPDTSISATLTTLALPTGKFLDTNANVLAPATKITGTPSFKDFESWSFKWSAATRLLLVDLTSNGNDPTLDLFTVTIPALIGTSITTGANVTWNSGTGTFSFNAAQAGRLYNAALLYGGDAAPIIPADSTIVFTALENANANGIQTMSFEFLPVPEPASVTLALAAAAALCLRRRMAPAS